ncbi:MAG: glycosyltransferase family 39 protein [Candidatus Nanoarchaeia archaeon]|nr:glycosyltransferase family 39 protein [Candidatus Nanoarchaeia archaeon]
MKKTTKILIGIFILSIIIKIILAYFIKNPIAFSDDYTYMQIARTFFYSGKIIITPGINFYPPLYPIVISIAYLFHNMNLVFFLMKVINSILSSLIIFPVYLLARDFLEEKQAIIVSLISLMIPSSFMFSNVIMAENLLYPLILFSIYFIYKSFTTRRIIYDILTGVFVALSCLTKNIGLGLLLIILVVFLYKLTKKHYYEIKKKIVVALFFILVSLSWWINNYKVFGLSLGVITLADPTITKTASIPSLFTWFFIYISYIILASGIILFALNLNFIIKSKEKNENILALIILTSIIIFIAIATLHSSKAPFKEMTDLFYLVGRPLGRYLSFLLPLIFIGSFIGIKKYDKKLKNILLILTIPLMIIASQLVYFKLFPINNMELVWIGAMSYIINPKILVFLIPLMSILAIFFLIKKEIEPKKLINLLIIFLILLNILSYIAIFKVSGEWSENPQIRLGEFLNNYDNKVSNILMDKNNCIDKLEKETKNEGICSINNTITIIGLKTNDNIYIGDYKTFKSGQYDFLISKESLDYQIIKEEDKIYIYSLK